MQPPPPTHPASQRPVSLLEYLARSARTLEPAVLVPSLELASSCLEPQANLNVRCRLPVDLQLVCRMVLNTHRTRPMEQMV